MLNCILRFYFLSYRSLKLRVFQVFLRNVLFNTKVKVKVKFTLVHEQRLCTARTVHRTSRGIGLLFLELGTRRGWEVSVTPRPLLTPGKDPVPIVQGAGWAPEPVWTGAENLANIGIRFPDRPARSSVAIPTELPGPLFFNPEVTKLCNGMNIWCYVKTNTCILDKIYVEL